MKTKYTENKNGFTLVEIMIVVAIIGLMATMALPTFAQARNRAQGVRLAEDLRVFGDAFVLYAIENGNYPADSHLVLPAGAGMEDYLNENQWNAATPIGGNYNWEGPDGYPYAGVSVTGTSADNAYLLSIDELVDDGNLSSGDYRITPNGRYTYIIEE